MYVIEVRALKAHELSGYEPQLAEMLKATVDEGGAVGFVQPLSLDQAAAFWRELVFPEVEHGTRLLFVAVMTSDPAGTLEELAGTVQLMLGLPANQPHRCEVAKMMVHPRWRQRGIASALMQGLESAAQEADKWLITLDTRTGDAAERLYRSFGFEPAGIIPDYALDPDQRNLHATTYMYKRLGDTRQ